MSTVDGKADLEELVGAWVRAREAGEQPDLEDYARRAGEGRDELLRRVRVYESLADLGDDAAGEPVPAAPARSAPIAAHAQLGRYEVLEQLDAGGLARVYLARDPDMDRTVALKVIEEAALVSDRAREWTLVEARSLGRLDHPGIVRVLDVDRADGKDFIVMEHVPGPTLADVLRELEARQSGTADAGGSDEADSPRDAERRRQERAAAYRLETYSARAELVARVARALAWCHDRGVLHRDVKPANVLVPDEGWPRLIDFGLAHIEQQETTVGVTTRLVGTAPYVAPEQVDAEQTGSDPASDQYSLGVVLYELLTLLCPFQRNTRALTLDAISRGNPRPPRRVAPAVPRDLERICLHALERDPARRYPSVEALARDLEAWLEHRPISIAAPSPARALSLWVRRNRGTVLVGTLVLGLAALAAGFTWDRGNRERLAGIGTALAAVDVDALEQPGDFDGSYSSLGHARNNARLFDDSFLRDAIYGRQEPAVVARLDAVSRRLRARLDALGAGRREWELGPELRVWQHALTLEREIYPEGTLNRFDQLRGTVSLPHGWSPERVTLLQIEPDASDSYFRLVPRPWSDRLAIGAYRVLGPVDPETGIRLQAGFRIDLGTEPALQLEGARPRAELLARTVAVETGRTTLASGATPVEVEVPGFRILRDVVTWADVRPFLDAHPDLLDPVEHAGLPADGPARLTWEEASRFARWAGMRLPGSLELHRATELGRTEWARVAEGGEPPPGGPIESEWTDDGTFRDESFTQRLTFDYELYGDNLVGNARIWSESFSAHAPVTTSSPTEDPRDEGRQRAVHKVAFRLALTD